MDTYKLTKIYEFVTKLASRRAYVGGGQRIRIMLINGCIGLGVHNGFEGSSCVLERVWWGDVVVG